MSKSEEDKRSTILLNDTVEEVHNKIRHAVTDSEPGISYDPVRRPGISNLIEILSHLEEPNGRSCEEIASEFRSSRIKLFKDHVETTINSHIQPIREKFLDIINKDDKENRYLQDIAEQGAARARENADKTMKAVRDAMGL
jgi:tryptophanyl-tRNA synthetase